MFLPGSGAAYVRGYHETGVAGPRVSVSVRTCAGVGISAERAESTSDGTCVRVAVLLFEFWFFGFELELELNIMKEIEASASTPSTIANISLLRSEGVLPSKSFIHQLRVS